MDNALYIHIPFCRRKCVYCDFYSMINDEGLASEYIDAVSEQIARLPYDKFHTIYIGGGTPTVLNISSWRILLTSLGRFSNNAMEFTVEANPESLDDVKVRMLLDHGVNRLSIGIQSLDGQKLKKLGRIHNAGKSEESVMIASKMGFKNISVDMIFGVWGETSEKWARELDLVVRLPVNHISCYSLSYEKGTPLFEAVKNKSVVPLEDDAVAAMYGSAIERLSVRGFKQYEVSNFSMEGYECKHNLNYWGNNAYLGIGPSAVSYIDGVRSKNVPDVGEYLKRVKDGKPLTVSSERLSPVRRAKETAAVKIRTREGIDFDWFRERTGFDFPELEKKALRDLLEKDLIKYKKSGEVIAGICLKRKGFLFCDTVSSALL